MKIDWKRKLSSRKFWAAAVGWLTSVLAMFGVEDNMGARIIAMVSGIGTLCVYMLAESIADSAHKGETEAKTNNQEDE